MSLRVSYTFIAPFYDFLIKRALAQTRANSLAPLKAMTTGDVLIDGIGTGLDLPYLPRQHHYYGLDITHAMLWRCQNKLRDKNVYLVEADSMSLPFPDHSFDAVVLHLITAVVPRPLACLKEAARVLKHGGKIYMVDKFLRPAQWAPLRRLLSPLLGKLATRLDVVLEDLLAEITDLKVESDQPALAGGWFRQIRLHKI